MARAVVVTRPTPDEKNIYTVSLIYIFRVPLAWNESALYELYRVDSKIARSAAWVPTLGY